MSGYSASIDVVHLDSPQITFLQTFVQQMSSFIAIDRRQDL